ncbi:glycosyltransferase family 4 protein [Candidatus Woesearchaeota archaeon]|nr:glycosyltransferase family 4 protein [Candidatus Woesearchaeota archaeon]
MKVLMFGWEFPPFKSGGLGTACYDLTKGLSNQGVDVTFVMPAAPEGANAEFVNIIGANNYAKKVKVRKINSILTPYQSFSSYEDAIRYAKVTSGSGGNASEVYGKNLYEEVHRYSLVAGAIAEEEDFDVIHVHDWMTYQAGINAKKTSGKPLVAHIHATEFDRTGGNPNQIISHIEFNGLQAADIVIANSNFTKENVIRHYQIDPSKIQVVHWGIDPHNPHYGLNTRNPFGNEKIVLFLGRITIQKGPDYFMEAANNVLQHVPDTKFIVVGQGDMFERMVNRAAELGILDKFMFTGWLKGADVHRAFQMADLYVMPSVAEPFGLVALESLKNGTPILVSKQSGVSEVVNHALKVDFWDVEEMSNKIINVLKYPELHAELTDNSVREVQKFNLDEPAHKVKCCYEQAMTIKR